MRRIAAVVAGVLVAALVGLGGASARADVPTCADFATQADAQVWLDAHRGAATDGSAATLDSDGDGYACPELPCPCADRPTPPAPVLPPAPVVQPAARTIVKLHVDTHHPAPGDRVHFVITRLTDNGSGMFTASAGRVKLQERLGDKWRTVPGSRVYTNSGAARESYTLNGGWLAVRALTVQPEQHSKTVRLTAR